MSRSDDMALRAILSSAAWRPPADTISSDLADALLEARGRAGLAADWRMAEAALGHPDALALWQEALAHLTEDRAEERARVHERLAALRLAAGDSERGCRHLAAALQETPAAATAATLRRGAVLGAHLLASGRVAQGEAILEDALERAMRLDETLWLVGLASTLAALRLEAEDWPAAGALGALVADAAARRGNWIGVADGLISQSTARFRQGDLRGALEGVLAGAARLQAVHALAALNLLRAHLVELRAATDDEDAFDALFDEIQSSSSPSSAP